MGTFLGRRFLQLIPTLLGVVLFTFLIMRFIPGDPTTMGGDTVSEEVRARLRAEWGLNDPLYKQFFKYVGGLARLDLGTSMKYGTPVTAEIGLYFQNTLKLGLAAFVFSVSIGVSLGILAALFKDTWVDKAVMGLALLGISTPVFVLGIGLILLAVAVGFDYVGEPNLSAEPRLDLRILLLPAITLGARSIAYLARMTRSSVLELSTADFLRTARAKGLGPSKVVFKHQLRNALIPIITVVGLNFADFLTGAILTETVFSFPGMGTLIQRAIQFRDTPMITGAVLFITFLFILINFLVDVIYAFADPRIRVG